ncbi:MAG: Citrate synthase 1 [Spirochaetes bacterium ADurb.Bin315]|jgi:citrate synthase|nr:citrate synthase [Spirochaetota bacterium]OQA43211.1 MAG: Citrate synthase 1 [Spirochaetes bacterium ADurb.Bin315]HOE89588.1 citrate synthase [Sphaerochaeta sp.]HOR80403.1 citrate synthase [Sphaerochaeta sp.]HPK64031.1 citrate synthase [Sphaerochaeta sp.]
MDIKKDAAKLILEDKEVTLPIITDSMGDKAIDITSLRKQTGFITYDPGYANTGSAMSEICYVDGEQGILRYRGYDIEDLVEHCEFVEVAHLLIKGELPNVQERHLYSEMLNRHSLLHIDMRNFFRDYPQDSHPMSILAAMVASLSAFYPELADADPQANLDLTVTRLLSKMRTIAAFTYRQMNGLDFVNPSYKFSYCENFLNMMFYTSVNAYVPPPLHVRALNILLILHADHEQNCSTSAVRLVGSSDANLYASVAAGCCALWGTKHGGANQAVMQMLLKIHNEGLTVEQVVEMAKNKENGFRLAGFGHRIYKTYDPRAKIAKDLCQKVIGNTELDPLLQIALELEQVALSDPYFIERNLYPNIDFYTGIIFHAMGIPESMFTVLFALGRLPGWIAHWLEWAGDPYQKIARPRQVYTGLAKRNVVPLVDRV